MGLPDPTRKNDFRGLLVGALFGALFAPLVNAVVPSAGLDQTAFAIVGMSAFFAAAVRAPFTGMIPAVEMTATTSQLVPMLAAAGMAVAVATLPKGSPNYDTLHVAMTREERGREAPA